jgi:hypothetical protein
LDIESGRVRNFLYAAEELDRAFDLQHHLRWTGEIIDRALRDGGN